MLTHTLTLHTQLASFFSSLLLNTMHDSQSGKIIGSAFSFLDTFYLNCHFHSLF